MKVLNFESARNSGGDSWDRADPRQATIARLSWDLWAVYLPDATDAHIIRIRHEGHSYVGECDCNGFEFHTGPCAHLCTLRKAEFICAEDVCDQPVRIADEMEAADNNIEKAVADGGRER